MGVPDRLRAASGSWIGTNRLYFPGEPTRDVPSTARIAPAAQGKFTTLSYTWSFDDQPQDGLLLIGGDRGAVIMIWIDSWHMGDGVMHCTGSVQDDRLLAVRGTYKVENHPDWGWRIDLRLRDEAIDLVMYNVSPEGEEDVAVEAAYARHADA